MNSAVPSTLPATGQPAAAEEPGDAEIGKLHLALGGQQQVARLDVAMDDAAVVGVAEGLGTFRCRSAALRARRRPGRAHSVRLPGCCRRPVPWRRRGGRPARRSRRGGRCAGWLSLRRVSISASKRWRKSGSWTRARRAASRRPARRVSTWTPS